MAEPRLLSLPREVRDIIWKYALQDPMYDPTGQPPDIPFIDINTVIVQQQHLNTWEIMETYWGLEPMTRLLRVNKQVHDEATEVLYGQFTFYMGVEFCRSIENSFPSCLSQRSRLLIQSLSLRIFTVRTAGRSGLAESVVSDLGNIRNRLPGLRHVQLSICPMLDLGETMFGEGLEEARLGVLKIQHGGIWSPFMREVTELFKGKAAVEVQLLRADQYAPDVQKYLQAWCKQLEEVANGES